MRSRRLPMGWIVFLTAWLFAAATDKAYAYMDPGTGSYLLQIAIGAALAAAFVIKGYWIRIKGFVLRVLGRARDEPHR